MLTDTAEKIILQSQITLTNVTKKFVRGTREVQALEGINLKIPQGAFVVIVGPSGCGKTTDFTETINRWVCIDGQLSGWC